VSLHVIGLSGTNPDPERTRAARRQQQQQKVVLRNRKTTTKKMMMNINLPTPDRQYDKESGDDTSYIANSYFK
jgi:hypothetical protein